jgi:hypothetical protein
LRVIKKHVATKPNCGKFLKTKKIKYNNFIGYQAVNESLQWLRKKTSGMVKKPRMIVYKNKLEMDNPQPSH